jgi:adenylate cyclase
VAESRRLAAIMFTDLVGYTALTQTDEARTLELLRDQEELVRPLLAVHHGREVKSTGDGFLVEFDSALMATQCAVDIQRRIHDRNAQAGVAPIHIRIGIHLGDVEQRGTDILGDAVNIAARIEPVAEPGGVCVSDAVQEQVWNKIPDKLEKLQQQALKGLQVSMDLYRVVMPWTVRETPSPSSGPTRLAVLPFVNISPDPKDEYFADGLTEELITVLSQLRELRVIARTSVNQYRSTPKSVSQIGAELGVSAVLEGSVRKAGDQLRITVQLIDVGTEEHTWANTFDRRLENVFAVQTEIARRVAKQLKVNVRAAEEARLEVRPAVRPDSYLAYLKGRTLLHGTSQASLEAAKEQFELAISQDPKNAAAHSGLADVTRVTGWFYPGGPRSEWDANSRRLAARAIELDPDLAEAHTSLALILWDDFEYVAAEKEFRLALSLSPSYSLAHNWYAVLLEDQARADEALRELTLAEAADPLWSYNLFNLARLLSWLGRLDEALPWAQKLGEVERSGPQYHLALAHYYLARSDLKRCLEEFHQVEELELEPRWKSVYRAWYFALSGEEEQAKALLRLEETLPEFPYTASCIAMVYAELHDLDECFHWLEKAIRTHNVPLHPFRLYPRFAHVRSDPRFQTLLKKMNLS